MNNEIQKFDFKGAALRTLTDEAGEPWFVLKDCMSILDLGNPTETVKMFDKDEFSTTEVIDSIGRRQQTYIISEPGLYRLVMKSRKPEAKEFQRWVTHEVLPSIRKHGGYMAGQERMTPEQMALASMRWLQSKVDEQAKQLKAQEGKVLFANAVETARPSILVGDFAKILKSNGIDIGPRRLFAWLREHGWLIKAKGSSWNMPTQKAMDLHLFEVKETTIKSLGRAHHDQQDAEDDRQGADVFRQTVPRETNTGSGCVMSETWLPACISLTAGLFSLSLALLRILVDLDPIGWILSLGECQESGKADAVGDVQITIIPVSNVRTGISSELANAVSFPVSDDAAVPGATHESNRNGTRGASNASAASSNGGVSL